MEQIKFRWVALNKKFNEIKINECLTTDMLLNGDYFSFFAHNNRDERGNCKFISEDLCIGKQDRNGKYIYAGDRLGKKDWKGDLVDIGYVKWSSFLCKWTVSADTHFPADFSGIEVVGNIHEDKFLEENKTGKTEINESN